MHPSLSSAIKGKQQRSVLKRSERIKHLMKKGDWDDDTSKIYGLPKIKITKLKIKKEKAAEKAEGSEATATTAAAPAAEAKKESKGKS